MRSFEINCNSQNKDLFGENYIKTTKYTPYSFLPLSIFYQYRRLANCFFLVLTVLAFVMPHLVPWESITMVAPTVFVLMVAVIREGIEDYYRYRSDKITNTKPVNKLNE